MPSTWAMAVIGVLSTAAMASAQEVSVYVDRDFGGAHATLKPGIYRLDRGEAPGVPNDSVSSLTVPFGRTVRGFENVGDDGTGDGESETYQPGSYGFIGGNLNDKFSLIYVDDYSTAYLSTDDPSVPSSIQVTTVEGHLDVQIHTGSGGSAYHKVYTYDVAANCTPEWWKQSRSGEADAKTTFDAATRKLAIDLWVTVRPLVGERNWVGVRFRCQKPGSTAQPQISAPQHRASAAYH